MSRCSADFCSYSFVLQAHLLRRDLYNRSGSTLASAGCLPRILRHYNYSLPRLGPGSLAQVIEWALLFLTLDFGLQLALSSGASHVLTVTLWFMMGTATASSSDFEESTGAAMFVDVDKLTAIYAILDPELATSAYAGHMEESFDPEMMAKVLLERWCHVFEDVEKESVDRLEGLGGSLHLLVDQNSYGPWYWA